MNIQDENKWNNTSKIHGNESEIGMIWGNDF